MINQTHIFIDSELEKGRELTAREMFDIGLIYNGDGMLTASLYISLLIMHRPPEPRFIIPRYGSGSQRGSYSL